MANKSASSSKPKQHRNQQSASRRPQLTPRSVPNETAQVVAAAVKGTIDAIKAEQTGVPMLPLNNEPTPEEMDDLLNDIGVDYENNQINRMPAAPQSYNPNIIDVEDDYYGSF